MSRTHRARRCRGCPRTVELMWARGAPGTGTWRGPRSRSTRRRHLPRHRPLRHSRTSSSWQVPRERFTPRFFRAAVVHRIDAAPANQGVGARSPNQRVIAITADEHVVPRPLQIGSRWAGSRKPPLVRAIKFPTSSTWQPWYRACVADARPPRASRPRSTPSSRCPAATPVPRRCVPRRRC